MNFSAKATFTGLKVSVAEQTYRAANRLSVEQSANVVLAEALPLVPVDTGELAASGHTEIEQAGNIATGFVVFDAEHASYNEFGTGIRGAESPGAGDVPYDANWPGMPATPFVRPALDQARPAIVDIFRENTATATKLLNK